MRRVARRGLRQACALLAATAGAVDLTPHARTDPPAQQQQPPVFRTEANFIRVDAYPTRGGRPVTDLLEGDFDVFEDGVPQKLVTFEHIVVAPGGPQAQRIEPNTVREGNQMAADPRRRVFVLFLDNYHVTVVPVTLTERDEEGVHWIVADVTLAPLAAGDYLVEVAAVREGGAQRVLAALRVER
jgi:hypothetical protein